jgi:Rhodanese-like domain
VTYCQGGVRAHTALALSVAGFPTVRVYDGSWAEWGNHPDLPRDDRRDDRRRRLTRVLRRAGVLRAR